MLRGLWKPSTEARMTDLPEAPRTPASSSAKWVLPAPSTPSIATRVTPAAMGSESARATVSRTSCLRGILGDAGRLEDRPGIPDEHLLDLVVGDAGDAQSGKNVVGDVVVVPVRTGAELLVLGEEIGPAVGVVREHHLSRIAFRAQGGQHLHPFGRGQEVLEAEAVHADGASPLHEAAQVAEVVAVAAVADDHAAEIDAFLGEDGLLRFPRAACRPGVGGDGHPGLLLGARARPQDVLDDRGDARGDALG